MTGRLKVMVVDDEQTTLELVQSRLRSAGHEVEIRSKALGTSVFILSYRPDVVLLDIEMPALNGVALAKLLVAQQFGVIFHSGKDKATLDRCVSESGALGHIAKGKHCADFLAELSRLLGKGKTA